MAQIQYHQKKAIDKSLAAMVLAKPTNVTEKAFRIKAALNSLPIMERQTKYRKLNLSVPQMQNENRNR